MIDAAKEVYINKINEGLAKLPDSWKAHFARCYGEVKHIPSDFLDNALCLVDRSVISYEESKEEFDKLKKEKGMTQDGLVRNGIKLRKNVKK